MKEVKVDRLELLSKVKKNRETHRELFLQAQVGYREIMVAELERSLQDAREGRQIRRNILIPEPLDHTHDYDRVIAMLEMSVDQEVTLLASEFDSYVMDNWMWKSQALVTNTAYSNKMVPSDPHSMYL